MWRCGFCCDDIKEWSLVIFSVKKDANLTAREDVGGEEVRIFEGLRYRMELTVCKSRVG